MKIASGNILNNDIKKNHEYEVFYDCEESIAWPDDEFYDCKNTEQYSTTVPISLQEDISRVLSQLAKITLAYEANRFSQHMLFNLGLGIPMTVLNSSWVIYRAIIGKATLSTALITSLPLIFSAILPQAERVTMLAGQIKHWLDKYLTFSLIEEWTSPDDDKFNGYLWLGILALIGHYYCQRTPLQPPQRRYLHLPPKLAELFSRICLYWQVITLEPPPRPVDGFGRLAFDRLEKERQARGRFLARSWARATGNNQQRVEQVAESYYGINRIPLSSTRPSGRAHASRTDADKQPYRQNSLADLLPQAIAAVRALPWPSLGLSGALLPLAQAVPINSMEALA